MEKSKQIQIGLLALVAILLGLNLTGVFGGGVSDKDASLREDSANNLAVNSPGTPAASTTNPTITNPSVPNPAIKSAEPEAPVGPTTTITFEETEYDFGTIDEGEKVSHKYKFTNTGKEPLIIKDAKGSCGCTVPQWPKDPVLPGETSEMLVEFNSKGKGGSQNKRVTITANTDPVQTFINIKGEVLKKPGAAAPVTPVQ